SLIRSLEHVGVDTVFGIPGGAILPAYDPLYDSASVRHILMRHEQGAGHAAEGYAYATGRPGVCMATSGPGATNLVTPLADAHMDSVPMVAITGQVASPAIGTDAFQEADICGITMPITKHNSLVKNADDIPRLPLRFRARACGHRRPRPAVPPRLRLAETAGHAGPPARDKTAGEPGARSRPDDHRRQAPRPVRRRWCPGLRGGGRAPRHRRT